MNPRAPLTLVVLGLGLVHCAAPAAVPSAAPTPDSPAPVAVTPAPVVTAAPVASMTAAPVASAEPKAPPSVCPEEMAYIPGGEYVFGQTAKEKVSVKPFCIDLTEVTTDA